jgi:mannosyltransferase OCH1-like enzyme
MRIRLFDKNFLKTRLLFYITIISLYYFILMKPRNNHLNTNASKKFSYKTKNVSQLDYDEKFVDFEGFDNIAGASEFLVPNIVHYVCLKQTKLSFSLFLSILSAWQNQKPSRIYIHCDDCSFNGKYWNELLKLKELNQILYINKLENFKETIFKKKPGWIHHKSDVIRILILMHYGGIYMDNDMILVNSLDKYRKFEIAVSWDSDVDGIGNQIFVSNRNARLLKAMYDGYR